MKGLKAYHFIGINGIGMSALAKICAKKGHTVSGSDSSIKLDTEGFKSFNITTYPKHDACHIQSNQTVVVSSAICDQNIELITAKALGCTIIKRGKLLADISKLHKTQIIITGTHGKTTTSSMITQIFQAAKLDPSFFIGGHLKGSQENGAIHSSDIFISEADESDGSFLEMVPTHAVITNIEQDHLDFYVTKKNLIDSFKSFFQTTIKQGKCAINIDDPNCKKLIKLAPEGAVISFGIDDNSATIQATDIQYNWNGISFNLMINNTFVDQIQLNVFGRHNIYNACAAIAISMANQVSLKHIIHGLSQYKGICRRLELKYKANNIMLFDDYAHHPTEIISTLEGVYKSFSTYRIIVIFQPHRYSRLTDFFDGFCSAFNRASICFIGPVYGAGEVQNGHKDSTDLVQKMQAFNDQVLAYRTTKDLTQSLQGLIQPKDIIVLMGAGDITYLAKDIIPIIKEYQE